MTEEDTFNILRRLPVRETAKIYDEWWDNITDAWSVEIADKFLESYGWTYHDMSIEMNKLFMETNRAYF